jgi:hypothetical protein
MFAPIERPRSTKNSQSNHVTCVRVSEQLFGRIPVLLGYLASGAAGWLRPCGSAFGCETVRPPTTFEAIEPERSERKTSCLLVAGETMRLVGF